MTIELEKKLSEAFPFMRKGNSLIEQHKKGFIDDLYSAFGIECGDGWYDLIYEQCTEIQNLLDESGLDAKLKVDQIKEKFGGLRFYYTLNFNNDDLTATDEEKEKRKELSEKLFKLVNSYEDKSYKTCEICGKEGKLREDLSWIQTLCDECYEKIK